MSSPPPMMITTWISSDDTRLTRRCPDRTQQRERVRLLERDDQEEQPGHARHDQAVEQEDDVERLLHLCDARCLGGSVFPRERVEIERLVR
jgi:hypothetical protein